MINSLATAGYYTTTATGAVLSAHFLEYIIQERPNPFRLHACLMAAQCFCTLIGLKQIFFDHRLPSLFDRMLLPACTATVTIGLAYFSKEIPPSKMHRFEARVRGRINWMRGRINWMRGPATRFVDQIRNALFPSPLLCQINPAPNQRHNGVPAITDNEAMMILRRALPHMKIPDRTALMQSSKGMCELAEGCIGKERRETLAIRDFCKKTLSSLKDTTNLAELNILNGDEVPFVQRLVRFARPEQLARVTHPKLQFQIATEALIQEKIQEGVTENTTIDTLNTCPPQWRPAIARQVLGSIEELKGSRQVADFLISTEGLYAATLVKYFPDQPDFVLRDLNDLHHMNGSPKDEFCSLVETSLHYGTIRTQNSVKEYLIRQFEQLEGAIPNLELFSFYMDMILILKSHPNLFSNEQIQLMRDYCANLNIIIPHEIHERAALFAFFCHLPVLLQANNELDWFINTHIGLHPLEFNFSEITIENSVLAISDLLKNPERAWSKLPFGCKRMSLYFLLQARPSVREPYITSIVNYVIENKEIEDHRLLIRELLEDRSNWRFAKQLIDACPTGSAVREACINEIRGCVHSHMMPGQLPFLLLDAVQNILPQDEARKIYKSLAFAVKRTSELEEMVQKLPPLLRIADSCRSRRDVETREVFLSPPAHQVWQLATSLCALEC